MSGSISKVGGMGKLNSRTTAPTDRGEAVA